MNENPNINPYGEAGQGQPQQPGQGSPAQPSLVQQLQPKLCIRVAAHVGHAGGGCRCSAQRARANSPRRAMRRLRATRFPGSLPQSTSRFTPTRTRAGACALVPCRRGFQADGRQDVPHRVRRRLGRMRARVGRGRRVRPDRRLEIHRQPRCLGLRVGAGGRGGSVACRGRRRQVPSLRRLHQRARPGAVQRQLYLRLPLRVQRQLRRAAGGQYGVGRGAFRGWLHHHQQPRGVQRKPVRGDH